MIFFESKSDNPYFNLAAEEYLLRNSSEEVCMLWRSKNAVIAGKHQNILSEINLRQAIENNVDLARRISGGGTVYHDIGNINFTFIRNGEEGNMINFEKNISPVIRFLDKYGIKAVKGEKNEILAGGKKISGNAEHIYRKRLLHHGTLLFSTDLEKLHNISSRDHGVYTDKAVKSNRSIVINIKDLLKKEASTEGFMDDFKEFLINDLGAEPSSLNTDETNFIQNLATTKFSSWEWIFGWSPDYLFKNSFCREGIDIDISLDTHRGIITRTSLTSTVTGNRLHDHIANQLISLQHRPETIRSVLVNAAVLKSKDPSVIDDLVYSFF